MAAPRNRAGVEAEAGSGAEEVWERRVSWLALGDWGELCDELRATAKQMAATAKELKPDFVMALGDNFYPFGAESVESGEFDMWRLVFLEEHPALKVPWKVVLGNHDYGIARGEAELAYTTYPGNPDGLWQMRGPADEAAGRTPTSCCYTFSFPPGSSHESSHHPDGSDAELAPSSGAATPAGSKKTAAAAAKRRQQCEAHFVAFDSNATQHAVRRMYPDIVERFGKQVEWLDGHMERNAAVLAEDEPWRIYFSHHPFYTLGRGHQLEARCLRSAKYENMAGGQTFEGLDLESRLVRHGFDATFAGHDHVMQAHASGPGGIHHHVCGASIESNFYGGPCRDGGVQIDCCLPGHTGFATGEILRSATRSMLRTRFIDADTGKILHELVRYKPRRPTYRSGVQETDV